MFDFRKAGMLIVLLALPAFFFLFLRTCTTNHYGLPYFHPLTDSTGRVVINGQDTAYYQVYGVLGVTPGGDTINYRALIGKISAFYLGGGGDGEKKDRLSEDRKRLAEILGNEKDFQILERAEEGPGENGEGAGVIRVATGPGLSSWENILKIDEKDSAEGTLYESSSLVLVDGERYIRGYYDLSDTEDFDRAVAEIKVLSYQKKIAGK
ncbi:MAG: hypothetical protein ABS46_16770 [Cytophagaceae bacterium SCN 52-12]|nr:MAG: hypothetical protein ABS46_16770 [Cytophagaceae bacterium SCN 52-12]